MGRDRERTAEAADAWLRAHGAPHRHDGLGATFPVAFVYHGTRVTVAYRDRGGDAALLAAEGGVRSEDFVAVCLARLLVWWDLRDERGVRPLTEEVLRRLPEDLGQRMLLAVLADYYGRVLAGTA